MTDINPTGKQYEGFHPVVVLSIDYESEEVIMGDLCFVLAGTSKFKEKHEQVMVEPSPENGLEKITYFNIDPAWKINSHELSFNSEKIGELEEKYLIIIDNAF